MTFILREEESSDTQSKMMALMLNKRRQGTEGQMLYDFTYMLLLLLLLLLLLSRFSRV